jgi:hypothetical protein
MIHTVGYLGRKCMKIIKYIRLPPLPTRFRKKMKRLLNYTVLTFTAIKHCNDLLHTISDFFPQTCHKDASLYRNKAPT